MANGLTEIRKRFRQVSGRYDLADAEGSDTNPRADRFINDGQRFLDSRCITYKSEARQIEKLSVGQSRVLLKNCRTVFRVWVSDATERIQLQKVRLEDLMKYYADLANVQNGTPAYFCRLPIRVHNPADYDGEWTGFYDYGDVLLPADGEIFADGLKIMPPADKEYTVQIFGNYCSPKLETEADMSIWTERYPDTLVNAAMYKMELFFRNMEGARGWLAAVEEDIRGIINERIVEDWVDINQIRS